MYLFWEATGVRSPGKFELSWRHFGLALNIVYDVHDDDRWPWLFHIHFLFFNLFVNFQWFAYRGKLDSDWNRAEWGITCTGMGPHLHWGSITKVFDWPWSFVHMRHEVRRPDGTWVPFVGSWERDKEPDGRKVESFEYHYCLKNWTVQCVTALVYVERMFWRPRCFKWTGIFEKKRESISVEFSNEIGERTGSWKGGCVGCGYTLRKNETAEKCLRRMERELKF